MANAKTIDKKKLFNIIRIIISVILTVVFVISALAATALSGARTYLNSESFKNEIRGLDLKSVKFNTASGTTSVLDYMYTTVNGAFSSTVLGRFDVPKDLIASVISADIVDTAVKDALLECVDYYINSDYKEAKDRIKNNQQITYESVKIEDFKDAQSLIKAYVTNVIHSTVENTVEKSSDEVIVLVSAHTQRVFTILAVVSAIAILALCCASYVFQSLIFFGFASAAYGLVIKIFQMKFENAQTDKSIIGYVLLEPLADSYSTNANIGIIAGILLIGIFVTIAIFPKNNKKSTELQKES